VNIAPDPILQAGLMTVHWATVFARNWTLLPDVPVKMVNDLMEAIHEVPSILLHWNEEDSFDTLILHLSCFNQADWRQRVDNDRFDVPNLVSFFRDRLDEYTSDEAAIQ
jgi:hypothetical protein